MNRVGSVARSARRRLGSAVSGMSSARRVGSAINSLGLTSSGRRRQRNKRRKEREHILESEIVSVIDGNPADLKEALISLLDKKINFNNSYCVRSKENYTIAYDYSNVISMLSYSYSERIQNILKKVKHAADVRMDYCQPTERISSGISKYFKIY
jgi:hypothetical protein